MAKVNDCIAQHTPTPWNFEDGRYIVHENITIAELWSRYSHSPVPGTDVPKEPDANAAFIVRAINLYDALMAEHKTGECFCDPDLSKGDNVCEWCYVEAIAKESQP